MLLLLLIPLQIAVGALEFLPVKGQASFTFAAAGDFGDINGAAKDNFQNLKNHYPSLSFVALLGDLSYGSNSPDEFCGAIKNTHGFQPLAVTGNHDNDNISGYADACSLPQSWSYTGSYFQNYYLDWPQPNPIARFIATGAGTTSWDSGVVANAIDQAHSQGLWVFVFQHMDCITTGSKSCEVGSDYMDLLLSHKVDIWMEGHDHNYQRSKQLTCAVEGFFEPSCVVDSDNDFSRGAGTVLVNSGTGGQGEYTVNSGDPEAGYFQVINDDTHGFSVFAVDSNGISETFLALDGPLQDSFAIGGGAAGLSTPLLSQLLLPILAAVAIGAVVLFAVVMKKRTSRASATKPPASTK